MFAIIPGPYTKGKGIIFYFKGRTKSKKDKKLEQTL
jgi:hypothetical protein